MPTFTVYSENSLLNIILLAKILLLETTCTFFEYFYTFKIMKHLRILVYIIKHKYLATFLVFFIWIFFFDKNNLISQFDLAKKFHHLKNDKIYYIKQIKEDSIETLELLTNPINLEKFARERYLLKRDSEDIFLIVHKGDSSSSKLN